MAAGNTITIHLYNEIESIMTSQTQSGKHKQRALNMTRPMIFRGALVSADMNYWCSGRNICIKLKPVTVVKIIGTEYTAKLSVMLVLTGT